MANVQYTDSSALSGMAEIFPTIAEQVTGKRVIDFGCGRGWQAVAYAKAGALHVTGIEIEPHLAAESVERAKLEGVADKVSIKAELSPDDRADMVMSQNSFEHFLEPETVLNQWKRALVPGGRIYITFGPPWFAPKGAHMGFFCRLPWVQLLFRESTVMQARGTYRFDGAATYREAGLGKMSIAKFERVIRDCGLKIVWHRYDCVKKFDVLGGLPWVREIAINRVNCIVENVVG